MQPQLKPLVAALILANLAAPAMAVTKTWTVNDGYWDGAGGWSPYGVPTSADDVYLNQVGGLQTNLLIDDYTGNAVARTLYIDANGGWHARLIQSGGTLTTQTEYVGYTGTGIYQQSGGVNTVTGTLWLGVYGSSYGYYYLTAGTLNAGNEVFGLNYGNVGSFSQDGSAVHTVTGTMTLGASVGSTGNYYLSAGTLNTGSIIVGSSGRGTFSQTGGTHNVTNDLWLGQLGGGSSNSYSMTGGSLTVGGAIKTGNSGGTFNYNGGALSVGGGNGDIKLTTFLMGNTSGSSVNYGQTGGTVDVTSLWVGGSGAATYNMSGSSTLHAASELVGANYGSNGVFNQSGGTHTVDGQLQVGASVGSHGEYNLSGGALNVGSLLIGQSGTGVFNQTGGTNTVTNSLSLGALGGGSGNVYTLSGGTLTVGNGVQIGASGGTLNVNGGTMNVSSGGILSNFSGGNLNLNGGTLNVGGGSGDIVVTSFNVGMAAGSHASYKQTGGAVSVDALTLAFGTGATGTYTLAGGTLTATALWGANNATLNLDGGTLNGPASLIMPNVVVGATEGSNFVLTIASSGGANTFASLSADSLTVGLLGSGKVVQTGGSNTVGALTINDTYQHSGGSLIVQNSLVNNGQFSMAGTTLTNNGTAENYGLVSGYGRIAGAGSFENYALVSQSGNLTIANAAGAANAGNWDLASGAQLKLEGASLTNTGALNLNGGSVTGSGTLTNALGGVVAGRGLISTSFANAGTLALDSGNTTVSKAFTNSGIIQIGGNTAQLSGGAITNTGRIEGFGKVNNAIANTGTIEAKGGTLTLASSMANGGTLAAGNGSSLLFLSGLTGNTGTIRLNGGNLINTGYTLVNNGQIQVSTGASQLEGNLTSNSGSKVIVSGGGSLTVYDTADFKNGSELRVSSGAIATFFGQVYQRTGAMFTGAGSKYYEGGLSVGNSPGLGTDAGSVTFGAGNNYLAEIGGLSVGDSLGNGIQFDRYVVAGALTFGGTLKLVSWNGYVAHAGESYDLFDWGSASGTFASIDTSGFQLASGTSLNLSRLYTDGTISVTAVPEPETYAMLLAGLGLIGFAARRQNQRRAA